MQLSLGLFSSLRAFFAESFPTRKVLRRGKYVRYVFPVVMSGQFGVQELERREGEEEGRVMPSREWESPAPLEAGKGPLCRELGSEPLTEATEAQRWLDLFRVLTGPVRPQ